MAAGPVAVRGFVAFAAVQARLAVDAEYVVRSASHWGTHQAVLDPLAAAAIRAEAISLAFIERESDKMWSKLSQIAVIAGSAAALIRPVDFAQARNVFTTAFHRRWGPAAQVGSHPRCSGWARCCKALSGELGGRILN